MLPLDEEVRITCIRATAGSPAASGVSSGRKVAITGAPPPSRRCLRWEEDEMGIMGDSDIDSDIRLKTARRPLL
jgi:hypothetical protein